MVINVNAMRFEGGALGNEVAAMVIKEEAMGSNGRAKAIKCTTMVEIPVGMD